MAQDDAFISLRDVSKEFGPVRAVDRVSIELTTGMLAILFGFPWEERRKLTFWSDIVTAGDDQLAAAGMTEDERRASLLECVARFIELREERKGKEQGERLDFLTAMASGEPCGPNFAEALETQKVCDAVLKSAAEKRWVDIGG